MKKLTVLLVALMSLLTITAVVAHEFHLSSVLKNTKQNKQKTTKNTKQKMDGLRSEPHVHPEKAAKSLFHGLSNRGNVVNINNLRYTMHTKSRKKALKRHAFDNELLPILST